MMMRTVCTGLTVVAFLLCGAVIARAGIVDDIAEKNRQIQELERQLQEYQAQAQAAGQQSSTLLNEIKKINANISIITTQVRTLEASIERTGLEISDAENGITEAERQIDVHQRALGRYLRAYSEYDDADIAIILIKGRRVSDFFDHLNNLARTQRQLQGTIASVRDLQNELDGRRDDLLDKRTGLERLKGLQEIEQNSLASTKRNKDVLLSATKGQEAKFQELVTKSKRDIDRIREQIFYLQKNGISAEDAVKYAELAAIGAGIRPAFLLALLEIESRLGQNIGTGNWNDDMYQCYIRLATIYYPNRKAHYLNRAETEKTAFFKIVGKLGLIADQVKVSREPNYGCGGAMGPAQFIPSTWLAYEAEVTRITGHAVPNPWNIEDAFTAAAVKLARGGATSKTRAGEIGAAKAYIGGSTTCSSAICNSYSNSVLQKAAQIEQNL